MANKKITELTSATLPLAGTEELAIVQAGETKKVAVSEFGGAAAKRTIVINKNFNAVLNPVDNWQFIFGADATSNAQQIINADAGATLIGLIRNDIAPFLTAPFPIKLKRINISCLKATGGTYTLGVIKYLRANDQYFYTSNGTNQAILLEKTLFGGATVNQKQYTDLATTEIADVEISTNEDVMFLLKSTVVTSTITFNTTLTFEEV